MTGSTVRILKLALMGIFMGAYLLASSTKYRAKNGQSGVVEKTANDDLSI